MQVMRIATDGFETDSDTKGGLCPAESSRHVIFSRALLLLKLKIFYIS